MDKIILTPEDMQFLLDAEYKEVEFHLPFEKEIEVILTVPNIAVHIKILENGNLRFTYFNIIGKDGRNIQTPLYSYELTHEFEMINYQFEDFLRAAIPNTEAALAYHKKSDSGIVRGIFGFFYFMLYKDEIALVKEREQISRVQKSVQTKQKGARKNKIVRIKKTIYRLADNAQEILASSELRPYNWHVSEFNRRGHWRTYSSGKSVWIKPKTIKVTGEGDALEKEYRL